MQNPEFPRNPPGNPEPLSFLCLGAGAIGSYVGGSLAAHGYKVVFLEKPGIAEIIQKSGLRIVSGPEVLKVDHPLVVSSISEALSLGPFTVGLIALKSFDTESVVQQFIPYQNWTSPFLCLQNGVENEKLIERLIGQGKAIPGTLTSAIARLEPGTVKVEKFRGAGVADTHLLSRNIVRAFSKSNLNPKLFPDPGSMKWSKLLTNLIANASSAILDIPPESIFAHKGLFVMEREQLRETLRVMKAQGYRPVNLPKTPVKSLVFAVDRLPLHFSQWLLQHAVGKGRGQKMPSFHIDLHSGSQKSEVGYLNGAVVRFGKRLGLDTPVNARLNSILIDLTEGRIPIDTFSHNPEKLLEAVNLARKSP